jgi:hypothetical protein
MGSKMFLPDIHCGMQILLTVGQKEAWHMSQAAPVYLRVTAEPAQTTKHQSANNSQQVES